MSNTTTQTIITSSGLTLFKPTIPSLYLLTQIYTPTATPPTGNVIPQVGSLVIDPTTNNLFVVDSVDPVSYATTLGTAQMLVNNTNPAESLTSVISYGNDIFRLFYDTRTTPLTVRPDSRIVIYGVDNVNYQLVLNPGPTQTIISQNYNAAGNLLGPLVPLAPVTTGSGVTWTAGYYLTPCWVNIALVDGQEIFAQIFNSQGAQTALVSLFSKASILLNEIETPPPVIVGVTITSTQDRSNNEIFIFQNQNPDSLGIQVTLTYADGHTLIAPIDGVQCFLYGLEDFVASYPGLQQTIMVKYFLSSNQTAAPSILSPSQTYVTAEASLVVVSNQLQAGVKISVIPVWNALTGVYNLAYFLYSTIYTTMITVTGNVTINPATPYNGALYGTPQAILLELDMSQVQPTIYTQSTIYQQTSIITLQPIASTVRYILQDASNAAVVYGADGTGNRRAVLHYDITRQQYYVPTPIFTTQASFLQSFYLDANPPYDTVNETQAPTPTHFLLRDPISGTMLVAAPIALAQYAAAFSLIGAGAPNRYAALGSNVVVEFVAIMGTQTLVLYGVPVDVLVGVYNT